MALSTQPEKPRRMPRFTSAATQRRAFAPHRATSRQLLSAMRLLRPSGERPAVAWRSRCFPIATSVHCAHAERTPRPCISSSAPFSRLRPSATSSAYADQLLSAARNPCCRIAKAAIRSATNSRRASAAASAHAEKPRRSSRFTIAATARAAALRGAPTPFHCAHAARTPRPCISRSATLSRMRAIAASSAYSSQPLKAARDPRSLSAAPPLRSAAIARAASAALSPQLEKARRTPRWTRAEAKRRIASSEPAAERQLLIAARSARPLGESDAITPASRYRSVASSVATSRQRCIAAWVERITKRIIAARACCRPAATSVHWSQAARKPRPKNSPAAIASRRLASAASWACSTQPLNAARAPRIRSAFAALRSDERREAASMAKASHAL